MTCLILWGYQVFLAFLPRAGVGSVCLWHSSLDYMCACLVTHSLWLSLSPLGTCWCVRKGAHLCIHIFWCQCLPLWLLILVFGDHSLIKHGVHWFSKNSWPGSPGDFLVCLCLQNGRISGKGTLPDLCMGAGVLTRVRHHKHLANLTISSASFLLFRWHLVVNSSVYEALNY